MSGNSEFEGKKIYALVRGEYEDYEIVALFTNQEQAEKCLELYNRISWGYARIEEHLFDVPEQRWHYYQIRLLADGTVTENKHCIQGLLLDGIKLIHGYYIRLANLEYVLKLTIVTEDEEKAIQTAQTIRERIIEEDGWGDRNILDDIIFKMPHTY